jgi:hypothetical protein
MSMYAVALNGASMMAPGALACMKNARIPLKLTLLKMHLLF